MTYLSEWQEPPSADLVDCYEVSVPDAYSSVAIGHGLRRRDHMMVRFAGELRQMLTIADEIKSTGEPVACAVPPFAVLRVSRPPREAA